MTAPEALKEWRAGKRLSQEDAAKQIGVRAASWCDWENGKKLPRTDHAQDLERVTDGQVTLSMWAEWSRAESAARAARAKAKAEAGESVADEDSEEIPETEPAPAPQVAS